MADPRLDLGQQIFGFFKQKGLPDYQAAAVAGNMAWEGGGRTDLVNPWDNKKVFNSPHSFGIAQWNDRLPGLIDYARKSGTDIPQGDLRDINYLKQISKHLPLNTQLEYAWQEMQGPEKRAFDTLRGGTDLRSANAGAISYHRPAGWSWGNPMGGHGFNNRLTLADQIMRLGAKDLAAQPQQNYDMYGESVKPSPAPITTGSIQGRQMPQDPVTGAWTPEEVIKSRYGTANQFWDTRKASTPIGAIAEGLGGFFGMREKGAADDLVRQNQAVQQEALRRAAGAGSTADLARTMIASGIPQLGEQGVGILGKNLSAEEARNTPQARAQLEAQEQALKTAQQAYAHQEQMHPVERDLKRAQAEQARRKDALQRFKESILFGEDGPPAAPAAGVKPMSDQAPLPNVPGVSLVSDKPKAPEIDESKLSSRDWLRLQAKKDPLWVMNFMGQMDKDPSKAQEMLDQRRGKLTTGTKTKLEENLSGLVSMRGNLAQVAGQFKPEFLQVSNQAQQWWNAVRDKTGIEKFKLDPEEKSKLTEFAKFRSSSIGVLNARLKELSGAAVTESEYRRIAAELPNPGTGIADGDSPTQFKAKMDSVLRMANLGIARTHYLVRNGFSGSVEEAEKQMPLDAVPQKMNEVGNQILQELKIKNPGVADDKLIPQARQEVAKQFGISI